MHDTGLRVSDMEICPDCQITSPPVDGERQPYIGTSPSCQAIGGEILASARALQTLSLPSFYAGGSLVISALKWSIEIIDFKHERAKLLA